jgi:hypothetical protein
MPLDDPEAIFSMWQESKRKDIERFFVVFKKKSHIFTQPILLHDFSEITEAFYCYMILHNIAVKERIALDDGTVESDGHYDVVQKEDAVTSRLNKEALYFVQLEEEDVECRLLELEYLVALGINIHDSTLSLFDERVTLNHMAEYCLNKLYNVAAHERLQIQLLRISKNNTIFTNNLSLKIRK